jgi:hypothetical protein
MSLLVLNLLGTPDGSTIRGKEHESWYSAYDFMTKRCVNTKTKEIQQEMSSAGSSRKEASTKRSLRLRRCRHLKSPGSGKKETPCMTIRGLQRLLMILRGKAAAEFREIVERTFKFTRVMAGDQSLIEVINANAASQAPVQQAYREALAQEPVSPVLVGFCLRRKRERKNLLFDMDMAERRALLEESQPRLEDSTLALEERKRHHTTKPIEHIDRFDTSMGLSNALKAWAKVDERTKPQAEAHIKNVLFNKMTGS